MELVLLLTNQGSETPVDTQKNRRNPPKKSGKNPTPHLIQFRIW